ncbi:hypothetical protein SAMN05660706_1504 [Desulfoscipio geothermicus DSM 3669]|uniref:Integrase n=1 Tax=Desulfoscipio geothermicus DSM 3669 TaxID=1121426 RepID=A0A1I6EJI7_9FIRM|nr:hypothetical protein SAMN05660706_1504 [Desulfoscipio geothermicus DSM 3669]
MDIKHLKLDNLKWKDNRIVLTKSKTSRALSLPLLHDVGWAIIDYLKPSQNIMSPTRRGYPLGLKGENIPLECRILAIADDMMQ